MGKQRYCSVNHLSGSGIISSGVDSDFPVANLYNERPGKPCKLTGSLGAGTPQYIKIDTGAVVAGNTRGTNNFIALMNHTIADPDAAIPVFNEATLQANSSDSWLSPAFETVLTWQELNMGKMFTSQTYRYWRLLIEPVGGGNLADCYVGELFLGNYTELTKGALYPQENERIYRNVDLLSERGQPWSYKKFNQWKFIYKYLLSDSYTSELETLRDAIDGSYTPFIWIPDAGEDDYYYVKCNRFVGPRHDTYGIDSFELEFTEIPVGEVLS